MKDLRLIKASNKDTPFLISLRKSTVYHHTLKAWLLMNEQQHKNMVLGTLESSYLIQKSGKNIWVLSFKIHGTFIELLQIQILPEYQNNGIGKFFIAYIVSLARTKKKKIQLKVLKNNPVKKLYFRFQFKIIWEDSYFYIMERN